MYQYVTHFPLASSKSYLMTLEECACQLKRAIKMTNLYRKNRNEAHLSNVEIDSGQRALKLDLVKNPSVMEILGPEKALCTENLARTSLPIITE